MPNVDGAELARLLRDRHGPGMVLVGITGDASVDAVRDPRLSCLDHCFRKPIGREQLARIF